MVSTFNRVYLTYSEPSAPEMLFKSKNQYILATPLFTGSSFKMKTARENMVGLALLITSELVMKTAQLSL